MHSGMARLSDQGTSVVPIPVDEGRYAYSFTSRAGHALFYMGGGNLWQSDGPSVTKLWDRKDMPLGFIRWMTPIPRGLLLGAARHRPL
jgi:hypothetical protein